jgi:hypothetical protein
MYALGTMGKCEGGRAEYKKQLLTEPWDNRTLARVVPW